MTYDCFGLRQGIALISTWMLLPSLALVLTSELLTIALDAGSIAR
jgi:hypothetical protein